MTWITATLFYANHLLTIVFEIKSSLGKTWHPYFFYYTQEKKLPPITHWVENTGLTNSSILSAKCLAPRAIMYFLTSFTFERCFSFCVFTSQSYTYSSFVLYFQPFSLLVFSLSVSFIDICTKTFLYCLHCFLTPLYIAFFPLSFHDISKVLLILLSTFLHLPFKPYWTHLWLSKLHIGTTSTSSTNVLPCHTILGSIFNPEFFL